ncbi:hypothetical protein M9Y10_043929 [Tritrichomonas musculus]|uniref:Protein kinase domain-containing protein n=1 Tax=Tritrichomonas musculus TaxID=1915356 RepID=A0ABR2K128_9EUKA
MITETKDPNERFVKMNQVKASYHDFVCYLGVEQSNGIQVYWYEFINDKLTEKERDESFQNLSKVKNIHCPIILNIIDLWKTSLPQAFVVITEAAQFPSLPEYMRMIDSRPSQKNLIKWFKNLATGVQALHHLNIWHGSLSLSKVFIKPGAGTVKLSLPLSTLSGRKTAPSSINLEVYNAPERLRGIKALSNDIWSLGIILIELFTGEEPYNEAETPEDLFNAIVQCKPPRSIDKVESPLARDLINKCLTEQSSRINIDMLLSHNVFKATDQTSEYSQQIPLDNIQKQKGSSDIEQLI